MGDTYHPATKTVNEGVGVSTNNMSVKNQIIFNSITKTIESNIKKADKAAAWFEAIHVAGYKENEALQILKKPNLKLNIKIKPLSPKRTIEDFLKRFNELIKK
jgi:hypothetical protein